MNLIRRFPGRCSGCLLAAALLAAGLLLPAGTAHAGVLDVTCAATNTTNYSPGLLLTTQSVTITATTQYAACVSASDPDLMSGYSTGNSIATLSCLNLGQSASGVEVIYWNDSTTSTFSFNRVVISVGGQSVLVRTGSITAGKFAGDTAVSELVLPALNTLDCLGPPGVTSKTSIGTLEATSL